MPPGGKQLWCCCNTLKIFKIAEVPNRKPGFGTPAALCKPNCHWPTDDGGIITNLVSVTEAANAADAPDARVIAAARVSVVLLPVVGVDAAIRGEAVGEVDDFPSDIELMLLMLAA